MIDKPRLLDLCCCQGGASAGYHRAGFDVTGVDITPQPRYPFRFILGDAIEYLKNHAHEYDVITGSPPCQLHSRAWKIQQREHPELIAPMRIAMQASGKPYVIENVIGAPLHDPVLLCGAMFGLRTYRHRIFESNMAITVPDHPEHIHPTVKMGRVLKAGEFYHAVGNFSNVAYVRADLDAAWMNRDGLRESIPPIYAEHIGRQLISALREGSRRDTP